jgi:hypothetical protein
MMTVAGVPVSSGTRRSHHTELAGLAAELALDNERYVATRTGRRA